MFWLPETHVTLEKETRFKKPWTLDGKTLIPEGKREKYVIQKTIYEDEVNKLFYCKLGVEHWCIGLRKMLDNKYQLTFVSEYIYRSMSPLPKHLYQAYVLKAKDEDKGFAQKAFNFVFNKSGIIGSDEEQTDLGFRYWNKLIEKTRGYAYYCINRNDPVVEELEDQLTSMRLYCVAIPVKSSGGKIQVLDKKYERFLEGIHHKTDSFFVLSKNKLPIDINKVM